MSIGLERHIEDDLLSAKYMSEAMVQAARDILGQHEQTEDAFLGAQAVLLLNGLL